MPVAPLPPTIFLLDSDATLTLCYHPASRQMVRGLLHERVAAFASTVELELRDLPMRNPPVGHAGDAAGLLEHADSALTVPSERSASELLARTEEIQARLVRPGDSAKRHLGEAATLALAETHGRYAVVTDDRDARTVGKSLWRSQQAGGGRLPVAGSAHLLRWAVAKGRLTAQEATQARDAALKGRRGIDPDVSFQRDLQWLRVRARETTSDSAAGQHRPGDS